MAARPTSRSSSGCRALAHHRPIEVAVVALSLTTTAATFLPWASSGERARSSYELVDVVERAGILPTDTALLAQLWLLAPLLCASTLLAFAAGATRTVAGSSIILGVLVALGGVLVVRSPLVGETGLWLATLAGASTALAGFTTWWTTTTR